jgi:hypothetical protein
MTHDRARRLLGVGPEATAHDVDGAFRRLAQLHHPDHGGDTGRFVELVAAREALQRPPAARGQLIVIRTRPWRRAVRVVQRWRFQAHRPRPSARVR